MNVFADVNLIGDINVGPATVGIQADNVTTATNEKITADFLTLDIDAGGTATVNTNVNSLSTINGTGSVVVTEDGGIALNVQSATDLTVTAGAGDITTSADFSVANLDLFNDNGNVVISNNVTGTTSIVIDTQGGAGGISGAGTLIGPDIDLFSDTGNITANVNGVGNISTSVGAQADQGGDVSLTYLGTGTLTLEASTGNGNFTVAGTALNDGDVAINGNIDGTGSLDITTDTLSFNGAFELDFDDISVQSFLGTGLTINGTAAYGTFTTTDGGAGTSFTATDGNLTFNSNTQYNGGDVFATLAVNNGINAYTNNGNLNGDGAFDGDPAANALTITAAIVAGAGTTTNFSNVFILQGNTIVNNSGDVTLAANLIFQGQSLAIIASGNVTTTGATLIDLSSNTTDGGTLTVLAGYNSTGTTVGNVITQTANPVTVTGPSATGGNINLAGVTINTSSTAVGGDGGDVLLLAQGGVGGTFTSAGTVTVGPINTNGDATGGTVLVGGSSDVTVGNISTIGTTSTDGSVVLGVGTATIQGGSPIFTNGVQSGGVFAPGTLTAGDLTYGTINAGTGDVNLAGAFTAADTIGGGAITSDTLAFTVGAGAANVSSTSNRINATAVAAGGSISVTETNDLIIDAVTGTDLDLAITTTGDIDINGAVAVGAGTVQLTADDVTQGLGSLTANSLGFTLTGNAALATNITNLLNSSGATITLTNTGALTLNDITATDALSIINNGALSVAAAANILSNQSIFIQTADAGNINIGDDATIETLVAVKVNPGDGDVTILQGAAPTKTKNLKAKGVEVVLDGGLALQGKGKGTKKVVGDKEFPSTVTARGANVLIKAQNKKGIILGQNVIITADPPVVALAQGSTREPKSGTALQPADSFTTELLNAPSVLAPINTVATLTSAPSINLNNTIDNTLSNLATANTNLGALGQMEDDSFMVTYAPMGYMVDGNVCSDMDFGFTSNAKAGSGNAVSTMKHSECVTMDNGSALFVPSKNMTIVTPKGSVKLAANSVAFVSVDGNQLSVYDINDNHKSSVVVSTGGRDLALSPGRHLVVTHDKASNFAEVNPIESIMHRSVAKHELGAGKRAFVSEFSIPSAVSVVKPLKAMLASSDAEAKKVAARILKTSAVVMMVGGQAQFDYHAKPRTVALSAMK
ncbi:MAG: hypothetical protein SGJ27_02755 [Candidatus Melainabacteria bacterium]|nr:hypothetical protein [Candidatus Melainabacteria bacterium]